MKVKDFLLKETKVGELCVIRMDGWIAMTAWIDHEDLFAINQNVGERIVKSNEWGMLPIITEHGDKITVPCHYIDC